MASNLLDWFGEQSDLNGVQQWAQAQAANGKLDPALADLAQNAPRQFQSILPDLLQKQQEQTALGQLYGGAQQPVATPTTQLTPDASGQLLPSSAPTPQAAHQQPSALQKMAQTLPYLPPALQQVAVQQMMFQGMGDGSQSSGGISGDAYLKTLAPPIATQVKAMVDGRIAPPSSMALKTPYWQQMLQAASTYDPNFDETTWTQRNKTVQDFNSTGGKSRQNITAVETALNHLSSLQDASSKLGGWGIGNTIRDAALSATNDPDLVTYNNIAKTAADEVAKATAGPNGSTQSDREERLKTFTADQSPAARQAAIQSAIELLNGRLEPMAESYNNAMGVAKRPTELLSPNAQAAYQKIMGIQSPNITATGNYNPAQDQPSALSQMATPYPSSQPSLPDLSQLPPDVVKSAAQAELARRRKGK